MGGDADAVLQRAARFGDGWAPWLTKPAELPRRMDFLRSQPGFDDRPFSLFYSLAVLSVVPSMRSPTTRTRSSVRAPNR